MAETEDKSNSIPWLPLIALIGVSSGVFLFFPPLISSRPEGGESQLAGSTVEYQTTASRLWQDPLGVAFADREKNINKESSEKRGEENFQKYCKAHSVGEFQKLVVEKCFTKFDYPLDDDLGFSAEQAKQIHILAVMIPGGPYVEHVESRLRSRRALIEGLASEGYVPENDDEIGYFNVPWQPLKPDVFASVCMLEKSEQNDDKQCSFSQKPVERIQPSRSTREVPNVDGLLVPYEWFTPEGKVVKKRVEHVLVLWLIDNSFRDAPLARLADLISWFCLKSVNGKIRVYSPPVFHVLGPDNSGTLYTMIKEAALNPWSDEVRKRLTTTHIYSWQATAAESRLRSEIRGTDGSFLDFASECKCKYLIENIIKWQQLDNGFSFDRMILPDDEIVKTMWQELENRGVKSSDRIAIISEEDTFYARALSSLFVDSRPTNSPLENLSSYTYLRGIDGKLPSDGKDQEQGKVASESTEKNTRSFLRPTEKPEGLNQADGIRRLAKELQKLNTKTQLESGGMASLKAIGLLGSDVYDKLELLKALHPLLPEAVFFTNNLDARLFHPDEWNETHNLVVVSPFGLSSPSQFSKFRDSAQTALFEATREAMEQGDAARVFSFPRTPYIFEIGRNGPKELAIPVNKIAMLAKHYVSDVKADDRSHAIEYLLRVAFFLTSVILIIAWTRSVSRAA